MMDTALWIIAILMIAIGIVGTVMPALPGVVFVFGGMLLAGWIDGFTRIGVQSLVIAGVLAVIGLVVDLIASLAFARRAGASRLGLLGAAIGTVAGVFTGFVGLLFMPLLGAFAGEMLERRDMLRAGQIGLATWVGLLVAAAAKIAVVFMMLGVFVAAVFL